MLLLLLLFAASFTSCAAQTREYASDRSQRCNNVQVLQAERSGVVVVSPASFPSPLSSTDASAQTASGQEGPVLSSAGSAHYGQCVFKIAKSVSWFSPAFFGRFLHLVSSFSCSNGSPSDGRNVPH